MTPTNTDAAAHIRKYLRECTHLFKRGNATEHTYRGELGALVDALTDNEFSVTNEPKRIKCGAPDYIVQKGEIPVGYIEAKDIDVELGEIEKSSQMQRYLDSLDNLILTNYLEFRVYRKKEKVATVQIAELVEGNITPRPEAFASLVTQIIDFSHFKGDTIRSPEVLAKVMARKARMIREVLYQSVLEDEDDRNSLKDQLAAFRRVLIHNLTEEQFADMYAQTITYGLFTARLHHDTAHDFTRQHARELIPRSSPFLRKLFDNITGADLDPRVTWIVDDLCEIFRAANLDSILRDFGTHTDQQNPILHFYETFLDAYNPDIKKSKGVFYTPEAVVSFIVKAVDRLLIDTFHLPKGLADTATIPTADGNDTHKVHILDPAAGTGTFLAKIITHIRGTFANLKGAWPSYVTQHLLPRIHGFELLMAPYTMCHIQIERLLEELGYTFPPQSTQRLGVFLTNTLEEAYEDETTLFAGWLSNEAAKANAIKRDTPIMCVLGNPPYSGISVNKGEWITSLIDEYKYIDGEHFNERKHWLNDDYVKFIRYGEHHIVKNGSGILAYINPHGYLDNPTFRGMRWHLLQSFDTIYTIDLHGNSKKKEKAPDGGIDQNVFNIMQGVSINIMIKTGAQKSGEFAQVFHYDLYGSREHKYHFLEKNSLNDIPFTEVAYSRPYYFFVPKDESARKEYEKGFAVHELFNMCDTGIVTGIDRLSIFKTKKELQDVTNKILNSANPFTEFNIKDTRRVSKEERLVDLKNARKKGIVTIHYRPFDIRYMYLPEKNERWINSPRIKIMQHFLKGENVGLVTIRRSRNSGEWKEILVANKIISGATFVSSLDINYVFPLYLYQSSLEGVTRRPNVNPDIVAGIATALRLTFVAEPDDDPATFAPIDILDYIYALLHSPRYRSKYREFLKIDFPRVPYPAGLNEWRHLVALGSQLRQLHLLQHPALDHPTTTYPEGGTNQVTTLKYDHGRLYINQTQYFDKVPEPAWNFYIGGYQPAQKWLKERKGTTLTMDDLQHYQKIIVALSATYEIMQKIDAKISTQR